MLRAEFMEPCGISANTLANALHVPPNRVGSIINGKRAISADTALRLAISTLVSITALKTPGPKPARAACARRVRPSPPR